MEITIFPHMTNRESELENLKDEELRDILLFKERAINLANAQHRYNKLPASTISFDTTGNPINFEANMPDEDEIINIAVKYRFFYGNKEPTKFEKIANLIRRKAKDEWAINYIDHIKMWHKQAMKNFDTSNALGHPISNKEILNLWFNSKFFHSDFQKQEKLENINHIIGQKASLFQLYGAITKCACHIKSFYSVIHKIDSNSNMIYTPNHHFRLNKQNNNSPKG